MVRLKDMLSQTSATVRSRRAAGPAPMPFWIRSALAVFALSVFTTPPLRAIDETNVVGYAQACFQRLELKEELVEKEYSCKAPAPNAPGYYQLFTSIGGIIQDININGLPNSNNHHSIPALCDRPAWLGLPANGCYGNSYLQVINFKGNDDVTAALLCRHKKEWTDDDKFPDIAMIVHSKKNGQTCWFQTNDSEHERSGSKVPSPLTEKARSFWMTPKDTAAVQCIKCHDNGPWMNSRWMNDNLRRLKRAPDGHLLTNEFEIDLESHPLADDKGLYINQGPGFDDWKAPTFITVGREGLDPKRRDDPSCTSCHHIAAAETTPDGKPYRTCASVNSWISHTTGSAFDPYTNSTGTAFEIANWMPEHYGAGAATKKEWSDRYSDHIKNLVTCCTSKLGIGCKEVKVSSNSRPSASPGIRLAAATDTGVHGESSLSAPSTAIQVNTGARLTMSWSADKNFYACTIEATFPEDVRTYPPGVALGVGTASNWQLDDSPQEMGKLTAPGAYRFDIYCGRNNTASLTVNAITPPPPPPPPPPVDCHGVTLSPAQATFGPTGGSGVFAVILPDPSKCSVRSVDVPTPLGWIMTGGAAGACGTGPNTQCVSYSVGPLNPPTPPGMPLPLLNPPRSGFVEVVLKDMSLLTFHVDQHN
jgi:hypothetical protein